MNDECPHGLTYCPRCDGSGPPRPAPTGFPYPHPPLDQADKSAAQIYREKKRGQDSRAAGRRRASFVARSGLAAAAPAATIARLEGRQFLP